MTTKQVLTERILELAARDTGVRPCDVHCTKYIAAAIFKQLAIEGKLFKVQIPGGNTTLYFRSRQAANAYFSQVVSGEREAHSSCRIAAFTKATQSSVFPKHSYQTLEASDVVGSGLVRSL